MNTTCVLNLSERESIFREGEQQNEHQYSEGEDNMFDANELGDQIIFIDELRDEISDATETGNDLEEDEEQMTEIEVLQPREVEEPKVRLFYNEIDELFEAYLRFARSKGLSVAKKATSEGNGSFRKYQTISSGRGRKSTANKHTKMINYPARLSAILR